jgi:hypothetical protein
MLNPAPHGQSQPSNWRENAEHLAESRGAIPISAAFSAIRASSSGSPETRAKLTWISFVGSLGCGSRSQFSAASQPRPAAFADRTIIPPYGFPRSGSSLRAKPRPPTGVSSFQRRSPVRFQRRHAIDLSAVKQRTISAVSAAVGRKPKLARGRGCKPGG